MAQSHTYGTITHIWHNHIQDEQASEWLTWAPYNGQAPTSLDTLNNTLNNTLNTHEDNMASPTRSPSFYKRELAMQSTGRVLEAIAVPAVVLCSSISTSVLIFPFFTYVPSSGHMAEYLPQVQGGWGGVLCEQGWVSGWVPLCCSLCSLSISLPVVAL